MEQFIYCNDKSKNKEGQEKKLFHICKNYNHPKCTL